MTIAYWCVLVAGLLPFVWTSAAKFTGRGFPLRYNHNPREFLDTLDGARRRAHWAQLNAFEAFPFFAAGIIIAQLAGATQAVVDVIALLYVLLRILHGVFYVLDKATLRSIVWFAAQGCVIALFVSAA